MTVLGIFYGCPGCPEIPLRCNRYNVYEIFVQNEKPKTEFVVYSAVWSEKLTLTHERVDDIPLLIGLAQKLHFLEVLDHHQGNHGNHQGLRNGWLATVWLAYILSESDHRKSSVEEWAWQHRQTLERMLGQPIGIPVDGCRRRPTPGTQGPGRTISIR